jgi:hypothetical protein
MSIKPIAYVPQERSGILPTLPTYARYTFCVKNVPSHDTPLLLGVSAIDAGCTAAIDGLTKMQQAELFPHNEQMARLRKSEAAPWIGADSEVIYSAFFTCDCAFTTSGFAAAGGVGVAGLLATSLLPSISVRAEPTDSGSALAVCADNPTPVTANMPVSIVNMRVFIGTPLCYHS